MILRGCYGYRKDYEEVEGGNSCLVGGDRGSLNGMYWDKLGKIGFKCWVKGEWGGKLDSYRRKENDEGSYGYEIRS